MISGLSPQTGQPGSRRSFISRNVADSASYRRSRPTRTSPVPQDHLDRLDGLHHADCARQYAENARFRAARSHAGRRRCGIETAIAGPAGLRIEYGRLALELEDASVNVGLAQEDTGVVHQISGGEVVAAVHDDIVILHDLHDVLGRETLLVRHHLDVRIQCRQRMDGGFGLRHPDVRVPVEDLPLKIAAVHDVEIHDAEGPDPCGREVKGRRRSQTARAEEQDLGL